MNLRKEVLSHPICISLSDDKTLLVIPQPPRSWLAWIGRRIYIRAGATAPTRGVEHGTIVGRSPITKDYLVVLVDEVYRAPVEDDGFRHCSVEDLTPIPLLREASGRPKPDDEDGDDDDSDFPPPEPAPAVKPHQRHGGKLEMLQLQVQAVPRRSERGVILVEMCFATVVFCMLALGILDMTLATGAKSNVGFLATQAAVCASKPGCDAAGYVLASGPGLGLNPARLTVIVSGTTVTVSYAYKPVGPVFPAVTLQATATATAT